MKLLCRFIEDNDQCASKAFALAVKNLAARGSLPIKVSKYIEVVLIVTKTSIISRQKQISQRSTCISENVYTNLLKFEAI